MKFLEAAFDLSIEGHFLFSIPRAFKSRALSTYATSSIVSYSKLAIVRKISPHTPTTRVQET
jgi:hypothetical protein